jgi:uncharacterized protein (DUF342 family)
VSDGFKIYSGGSVLIKQTFDVTEAITTDDLTVIGGIIGRGQGILKIGGSLKAKFIGNCHVACRKGINVETELINSNVYTLENLLMGEKGRIVGGEIYALKGIKTGGIGKKAGKATRIHCGVDFTLEQEKEKQNGILKIISAKMIRIKELLENPKVSGVKREQAEALLHKLTDEQKKTQSRISDLLSKIGTYWTAEIEVLGDIFPGTLIEICKTALFVTETLKKVRIRLDREKNKLITEPLT